MNIKPFNLHAFRLSFIITCHIQLLFAFWNCKFQVFDGLFACCAKRKYTNFVICVPWFFTGKHVKWTPYVLWIQVTRYKCSLVMNATIFLLNKMFAWCVHIHQITKGSIRKIKIQENVFAKMGKYSVIINCIQSLCFSSQKLKPKLAWKWSQILSPLILNDVVVVVVLAQYVNQFHTMSCYNRWLQRPFYQPSQIEL